MSKIIRIYLGTTQAPVKLVQVRCGGNKAHEQRSEVELLPRSVCVDRAELVQNCRSEMDESPRRRASSLDLASLDARREEALLRYIMSGPARADCMKNLPPNVVAQKNHSGCSCCWTHGIEVEVRAVRVPRRASRLGTRPRDARRD